MRTFVASFSLLSCFCFDKSHRLHTTGSTGTRKRRRTRARARTSSIRKTSHRRVASYSPTVSSYNPPSPPLPSFLLHNPSSFSHTTHIPHMPTARARTRAAGRGESKERMAAAEEVSFWGMNEAELRKWVDANPGCVNDRDWMGITLLYAAVFNINSLPLTL